MSASAIVTGGRSARTGVFNSLSWEYQDSGLLGALMSGTLDAPECMPAGGMHSHDSQPYGPWPVPMKTQRE